ncbi:MAG: hypothetical protein AABO57_20495, partial [Acidobacteriota bacterium]
DISLGPSLIPPFFFGGPIPVPELPPSEPEPLPERDPQQNDPCEMLKAAARAHVDKLLARSGLDQFIRDKQISESGKGYILKFSDLQAAQDYVRNSGYFNGGGSFGSAFHVGELQRLGDTGPFSDFRSFTGSSGLGKRSLQVTFGTLFAYLDTDKFNYRQDLVGFFGHTFGEVLPHLVKKIIKKGGC